MTDLEEIGKVLIKIGGILILVLGIVDAIKYAAYLILLHLAKGFLDMLIASIPILAGFSFATGLIETLGSTTLIALLAISAILAYFGFKLFKIADEAPMPAEARDRWMVILIVLLALSLLLGSSLLAASFLLPIVGLIIMPVRRMPPQAAT